MPAETTKIEKYIAKANSATLSVMAAIQQQVLLDSDLDDLDRAIFGLTGSYDKLVHYRQLSQTIGRLAGKPVIVVKRPDSSGIPTLDGNVYEADGGFMTGNMDVFFTYRGDVADGPHNIRGVQLSAEVEPTLSLRYVTSITAEKYGEQVFTDEDTEHYDRATGYGYLKLHSISRNIPAQGVDDTPTVTESTFGEILMDRPQIYSSVYFNQGISRLLQHMEEMRTS
ncbi:MAG TPA: hypothetical protein VFN31_01965 [Candidatus Saccharimonadales bacterium]|nr:hypothetical protein [Candidatus Saccharimonadales bacterium]